MKLSTTLRSGLLLGTAAFVLAACDGDSSVASPGDVLTVNITGDTGDDGDTTTPSGGDGTVSFIPNTGCPAGTTARTFEDVDSNGVDVTACAFGAAGSASSSSQSGVTTSAVGVSADGQTTVISGTDTVLSGVVVFEGSLFVGENPISNNDLDGDGVFAETGTLTIEPGTIIAAATGDTVVDTLIVSPGSVLLANGTDTQPIVFTTLADLADGDRATDVSAFEAASDGLVDGEASVGTDANARWGGLVLNGFAPINDCPGTAGAADCTKDGEGGSGLFGGNVPTDSSGSLRYVRVQYAGFSFTPTNQLNGIALQGVGSGTDIDFVQVHNNADDGIEFFGGTVNATHVVITDAADDSIDWTDGWSGVLQYAVVVGGPSENDNIVEGDNNGDEEDAGEAEGIVSNPVVLNLTALGNGDGTIGQDDGIVLRAGTAGEIANVILSGVADDATDFSQESALRAPTIQGTFVADFGGSAADQPSADDSDVDIFTGQPGNEAEQTTVLTSLFNAAIASSGFVTPVSTAGAIETAEYRGAFDPLTEQSIQDSWMANWTLTVSLPTGDLVQSCPAGTSISARNGTIDTDGDGSLDDESLICTLPPVVTADLRLTAGIDYELDGTVFVGSDLGGDGLADLEDANAVTLSIDPGVTIFAASDDSEVDTLVVSRGHKIDVNGTSTQPVVMTNLLDYSDSTAYVSATDPSERWGGLAINGQAPINDCTTTGGAADCEKDGEGGSGLFGGNDEADDSGEVEYLQIRNAGFSFTPTNQLNGIALQGVGNGTLVDFVEVTDNADDGIEFFGGTVNASHIIIINAADDSIDWTDGWQGSLQYALVVNGTQTNDNVFEGDNNGDLPNSEPFSVPVIANVTSANITDGQDDTAGNNTNGNDDGIVLRAGTDGLIANGIVVGVRDDATDFTQDSTVDVRVPELSSIFAADFGGVVADTGSSDVDIFTTGTDNVNGFTGFTGLDADTETGLLILSSAQVTNTGTTLDATALETFYAATPAFPTVDGTTAAEKAALTDSFLDDVTYVGAFENDADNWHVGWTLLDELN
ncbi:MAG: hypothetical protein AAFR65_08015 [Pseudomonadota bacterium]